MVSKLVMFDVSSGDSTRLDENAYFLVSFFGQTFKTMAKKLGPALTLDHFYKDYHQSEFLAAGCRNSNGVSSGKIT